MCHRIDDDQICVGKRETEKIKENEIWFGGKEQAYQKIGMTNTFMKSQLFSIYNVAEFVSMLRMQIWKPTHTRITNIVILMNCKKEILLKSN